VAPVNRNLYAIYLRKSRTDLELEAMGEGETLARHYNMLMNLASKHEIHPDQITVYKELVSGDSISERPEMQRLLTDVYTKKYKGVLVVEVERLARGNTKDQGEVADAFTFSGTHIITPSKIYDPNNEFDQEYFEFGLFMSRREYKTIKRRLEAGKLQSVMEGNYILSHKTFGYDIVRESKKVRYLVENPEQSKYVHMIFDWWTEEGKSCDWIAKQMTLMGVTPMKKGKEWSRNTIRDMLKNVIYVGKLKWNDMKTVKKFDSATGQMSKGRVKSAPEDVIIVEGKHKGIISEEQFAKAQARFGTQSHKKTETKLNNPLAGLLRCKDCGKVLAWLEYPDNRTTRLQHKRSFVCNKKSLPAYQVLDSFVEALKEIIADFEIKMESGNDNTELIRHQDIISDLEKELASQEKRKQRLFDSWEADDGTYTKEEFIERKQKYTATIEAIKSKIQEMKKAVPVPVNYAEQIVTLHQMIDCLNDTNLDAQAKNDFLKQYIDRIDYDVIDFGQAKGGQAVLDVYLK